MPRAAAMAAEMTALLWNHPSVVAYTVHNEPVHALRSMIGQMFDARAEGRAAPIRLGLAIGRRVAERIMRPGRARRRGE